MRGTVSVPGGITATEEFDFETAGQRWAGNAWAGQDEMEAGVDGCGPADGCCVAAKVCFENGPEARLRVAAGQDDECGVAEGRMALDLILNDVPGAALGRGGAADGEDGKKKVCQESRKSEVRFHDRESFRISFLERVSVRRVDLSNRLI